MGGKIKECFVFVFEVFKETFKVNKSPGVNIEGILAIIFVSTFCITAVLESLNMGIIPVALHRPMDVLLGVFARGGVEKTIAKRKNRGE